MFDLFDFTPVEDDPFRRQASPASPVVNEYQKSQPDPNTDKLAAASSIPTDAAIQPDTMVGKLGSNVVRMLAKTFAGSDAEDWAQYAANPLHPMPARIGSAVGEEARRFGAGVIGDVNKLMGPVYGEGHYPVFSDTGAQAPASEYAGAGLNLASIMGGPGGETGVGAGWNPKAVKYLDSLIKSKPPLKPETAAVVQQMINKGPEWTAEFNKASPPGTPGVGISTLATSMHKMEEAKKEVPQAFVPGPKPVKPQTTPWSPEAVKFLKEKGYAPGSFSPENAASLAGVQNPTPNIEVWKQALNLHDAEIAKTGVTPSVPKFTDKLTDVLKTPAAASLDPAVVTKMKALGPDASWYDWVMSNQSPGTAAAAGWTPKTAAPGISVAPAPKPLKKPSVKTVSSVPVTPEEALFGGGSATQTQLNDLFGQQIPALTVPTMKPYDHNVPFPSNLAHETAPGTSGVQQPFNPGNLPMDNASVMKRMQEQGFAPIDKNWLFWRGVKQHGPFSWDSAEMGYRDPSTKTNEPGLFLAPAETQGKEGKKIATMYGTNVNPHVVRADNPIVIDWKKEAGGTSYGPTAMQKVIKKMWAQGHDAVLLKGISDIGGHQDQLVVRHANQVRHPHAAFDPARKSSRNLLAARGTGGVTPLVVPDEGGENDEQ